jgi:hypothetical protein
LKKFIAAGAALLISVCPVLSHAGTDFLTVSGKISQGETEGSKKVLHISKEDFLKLPQHTIKTGTSWTKGTPTFVGPYVRDVLAKAGAQGTKVQAVAVDDYVYTIPASDFDKYPAILAYEQDGKPLDPAKYGPLWIIYPRDDNPKELTGPVADAKFVWQVNRLVVQ